MNYKIKNFAIIITRSVILITAFLPAVVFGQAGRVSDFRSLVQLIISLLNILIPLLIGIGLVAFLFGVVKYVTAGGSEDKMKQGRSLMIYGIIALFVMVSVWGLVGILTSTFFGGSVGIPQLR